MPTVGEIIRRLTPKGTLLQAEPADADSLSNDPMTFWRDPPIWPPDMFAITATLVRYSECYAHREVRGGIGLGDDHVKITRKMGQIWQMSLVGPKLSAWRNSEWQTILDAWDDVVSVCARFGRLQPWAKSALRLLAAADEASASVGFGRLTLISHMAEAVAREHGFASLTYAVDTSECCVQPKGRTPPVGCNLRSLSLHLSLLPPLSMVRTHYIDPIQSVVDRRTFGVVLIPFPYRIGDREFKGSVAPEKHWGRLSLRCSWGQRPTPGELARFAGRIVRAAKASKLRTDMLIFPELALTESQLKAVWRKVRGSGVQVILAGVHKRDGRTPRSAGKRGNFVAGVFKGRSPAKDVFWFQPKHHRWRIDKGQIESYGLPLSVNVPWWEDIDIAGRLVTAVRFTEGAILSALVCEDLARVEPVQPVLREMGLSLLVALLMDGPQLTTRWSARSATSFADDPGTSVLSVTSGGLVRRFQQFRQRYSGCASPPIALWQEPGKAPREVPIAPNSHAVQFCLCVESQQETTLDGRHDGSAAEVLRLASPDKEPFAQLSVKDPPMWARPLYEAN